MDLLVFLIDSPVISALAKTLLHFLWQGCVIAFGLYIALNTINKRQSELRYVISLAAMALCVAVPVSTFFWLYQPVSVVSIEQLSPAVVELIQAQHVGASAEPVWSWLDWSLLLSSTAILWFVGVIYLSIHLMFELFNVYQLPRRNVIEPHEEISEIFDNLLTRLQVNRFTKLLISLNAEVPMVVGFIKPVVLVPFSMASGLSNAQLEMLLAHELAHVKRHDYLVNFFQTLASILLFFHPLVNWISLQIRIEREYCCDDIAVQTCGNVKAYATALTDAESIRSHHIPQLAMAATGGDLKNRVVRMIEHTDCASKSSRSWHSMVLASLVAISMAVMLFSAHAGYQTRIVDVLHGEVNEPQPLLTLDSESLQALSDNNTEGEKDTANNTKTQPTAEQANASISGISQSAKPGKSIDVNAKDALTLQAAAVPQQPQANSGLADQQETLATAIEPQALVKKNTNVDSAQSNQTGLQANAVTAVSIDNEATKLGGAELTEVTPATLAASNAARFSVISDNGQVSKYAIPSVNNKQSDTRLSAVTAASPKNEVKNQAELISIVAPSLVRNARPNYPRTAIARNVEADVKVSFIVDKNGRISHIEFEKNVPGYFKRSIRKALKKWRFEPGYIDGKVSEMTLTRIFNFRDPDGEVGEDTTLKVTGSRLQKQI
ncbi:TonB family protein [Aliiglaciecola litoralis]|uniref:Protein TonB n=1 Tax=Aliiglaciecola litoralis TaxID=582857 RepID=A0ABN1LCZ8_9ALTE